MAEKRFLALEKRLEKTPAVKAQYTSFLMEYEKLGHMSLAKSAPPENPKLEYFLPHHYVLKPTSTTTQLRVVYDGSAATDTGISINQTQMTGPTIQNDLISILLNFSSHKFAFTADVPKFYRQVKMHKDDVRYQKIFWRENRSMPLREYELQTVTYGITSSPFLATMALCQLAEDEEQTFPLAAKAVRKSFYIDDVLTGANTLTEATELKDQIIALLERGGSEVHKFCPNSDSLLATIPERQREGCVDITDPTVNAIMKTLGISWNPKEDIFTFIVPVYPKSDTVPTKRMILSQIAKIFDPLGFVGPILTAAKLIMRELWALNLELDQPVPPELGRLWIGYRDQLQHLNKMKIARWIHADDASNYELYGFADASDLAYGASLYTRTIQRDGTVVMKLVCSKSRILPRKRNNRKEIITPKAELLAALLLSQLTVKVLAAVDTVFSSVMLWSDSQIVLCWLQKTPESLTVFVGNRVGQIQKLTDNFCWQYIPSAENPADMISRGMSPLDLVNSDFWLHGPSRFHIVQPYFEQLGPISQDELPELRNTTLVTTPGQPRLSIFDRISRFTIIQQSMAYVVRFFDYIESGRKHLTKGLPTVSEINRAGILIVRLVQGEAFPNEIQLLKDERECKSTFQNLNPFIDANDGILRVGGRLKNAAVPYEHRHPALLPEKHPFTLVLIRHLHRSNMHLGQRNLLGVVRQQYWPLKAKNVIRKVVHLCIQCFRMRPKKGTQLMGELPDYRVQPSPVFSHTGLDFAGPFNLRASVLPRNTSTTKGYVCVFVCMATRAIHLEAVSDLTTDSFMAALQRFISRRGLVHMGGCIQIMRPISKVQTTR
ncbi:uncharacterized protein LOC129728886 [Wyeomyia smithii]|uniref:uncharacterized protein LOC129728886 n=1 Tax=Wyeomyia smithii TaxID=174621 RepID=UPI002468011C|nr:uncharacterized protein LOC129728886 [Wyeomyia smithii]